MNNREELTNYLKKVKIIGQKEYQKIAELFEKVGHSHLHDIPAR